MKKLFLSKSFSFIKAVSYVMLVTFIILDYVGPVTIIEFVQWWVAVEKVEPSEEFISFGKLILTKRVVFWTIVVLSLESLSNFIDFFKIKTKS